MFNPRYAQGSSGDCFFRLVRALLYSLALHLLFLIVFSAQVPQAESGSRIRITAQLAALTAINPRSGATKQSAVRAEAPAAVASKTTRRQSRQGSAGKSGEPSGNVEGSQEAPSVMDVAAYRLAVGRVFSGLLDQRWRALLPEGELVFQVQARPGHSPRVALLSPTDSANAAQLQDLMEQAVARVAMPPLWQSRGYGIELRALVGG